MIHHFEMPRLSPYYLVQNVVTAGDLNEQVEILRGEEISKILSSVNPFIARVGQTRSVLIWIRHSDNVDVNVP